MPGETDLHKTLKKEACRWLYRMGYRCIGAEVRLDPVGIVDAVGAGIFRPYHNHLSMPHDLPQVCIIECKASRADFLRDMDDGSQLQLFATRRIDSLGHSRVGRRWRFPALAKFAACLARPLANLHYVLAPPGIIHKKDLPPRWGLLVCSESGVGVVARAAWQECSRIGYVESAIARTLTGDIYRADARALNSVNRQILSQQQSLADRIRGMRAQIVLAPADHLARSA